MEASGNAALNQLKMTKSETAAIAAHTAMRIQSRCVSRSPFIKPTAAALSPCAGFLRPLHPSTSSAADEAANLRLLAEAEDVGLHAKMLEAPHSSGEPDAGLHFIEDQQHVVFVAELPHGPEELGAEMVVAALSLDRLHDERGDFVLALAK